MFVLRTAKARPDQAALATSAEARGATPTHRARPWSPSRAGLGLALPIRRYRSIYIEDRPRLRNPNEIRLKTTPLHRDAVSVVEEAAVPAAVCRWGLCSRCPGVGRCLSGVNVSLSVWYPLNLKYACCGVGGGGVKMVRIGVNLSSSYSAGTTGSGWGKGRDFAEEMGFSLLVCSSRGLYTTTLWFKTRYFVARRLEVMCATSRG